MEKESSVCRPPLGLLPALLGVDHDDGWREGRWPSEKARRRCREERRDDGEEERKGCRNGVDELLSNILGSASQLSHERGKGREAFFLEI